MEDKASKTCWWQRTGLGFVEGSLKFGGEDLESLARAHGTPLYAYDLGRVRSNLSRLQGALAGLNPRIFYAMKSNRFVPLLSRMAAWEDVGIDACSIDEVRLAMSCGFAANRISFIAHAVTDREWSRLLAIPDLHVQCDGLEALEAVARMAPGRAVGLRIDPGLGVSYRGRPQLAYAVGKFGILPEELPEALSMARRGKLKLIGLHCHAGCGYLDDQLERVDTILGKLVDWSKTLPDCRYFNMGGGLGIPLDEKDRSLDLNKWAGIITRRLGQTGCELRLEPGDYLVKDAGVLVLEVVYDKRKAGQRLVGLNGGFALHPEPVFYDLPLEAVAVRPRDGSVEETTLAGNINEAGDIWHRSCLLGPLKKGDFIALLNAGGYGSSMASDHCLRGGRFEVLLMGEISNEG